MRSPAAPALGLVVVTVLGLSPLVAAAQEPGAARTTRTASAAVAVDLFGSTTAGEVALLPPPGPDTAEGREAWRLYHLAFQSLAAGRRAEATEQLRQLEASAPDHPLAARAREILARLRSSSPEAWTGDRLTVPAVRGEGRDSGPSAFARAELAVAQTIHGVGLGLELCFLAQCDDSRAVGAAMVAGGGLGLTLSLLLTSDGITPGHAALLNTGTAWGAATGFFTANLISPIDDDDVNARVIPASMMAGQLAGLGIGHLIWSATHASSGDVALVSSGGLWTDFLTLMMAFTIGNGDVGSAQGMFGALLASSAIGLGGGAFLADLFPMSRGRVLVMDGGGAVGALVGLGAALIIGSDESAPYFLLPAIGAASGLVLTTVLTQDWDLGDGSDVVMGVAPWRDGVMFNAAMAW